MKTKPKLSICIATFNRSQCISTTLESIIPQLTDETEILVADGASTDDTEAVVSDYASAEPRLRYVRLDKKGGVDQDYCKAVDMAEGEYCWLFTDDDLLKPGAISTVLNKIDNDNSIDLLIVNAEVLSTDLTEKILDRVIKYTNDVIYENYQFDELFKDTISYLSFIGGVVIRRSLWLQRERTRYFGSEFVHLGVIFQAPFAAKAYLIAEPCISIRYGNAQWNIRSFEIWMYKWPRLVWSFDGISRDARQSIIRKEPWRDWRELLLRRATGAYSFSAFRKFILSESVNTSWKVVAVLISVLPFRLLNRMLIFYFKARKNTDRLFMYDLSLATHKQ